MGILYSSEYKINDYITVKIPTVSEILSDEETYFDSISLLLATPYDLLVQLDDANIDFTTINDWDLFCYLFKEIQQKDFSMVFTDLDFKDFSIVRKKSDREVIAVDYKTGHIIDRSVHGKICRVIKTLLFIKKDIKRPANEEARLYLIERARKKMGRKKKSSATNSQLENYIIALVNTPEFKYDFETVGRLSIYQFYSSLHQIADKIRFDNLMIGCYAGTVDTEKLDRDELNWIPNK